MTADARTRTHEDVAWQDEAACNGSGLDFVPNTESAAGLRMAQSLYCNGCPVRTDCLAWAMLHRSSGYWGGTTTYQRQQLMRVRTRAKCPLCQSQDLVWTGEHELCLACATSWVRDVRLTPIAATPAPGAA